jgi:hypothetical protein
MYCARAITLRTCYAMYSTVYGFNGLLQAALLTTAVALLEHVGPSVSILSSKQLSTWMAAACKHVAGQTSVTVRIPKRVGVAQRRRWPCVGGTVAITAVVGCVVWCVGVMDSGRCYGIAPLLSVTHLSGVGQHAQRHG